MNAFALPKELISLAGAINDVDSHEMMPTAEWISHFGPEVQPLIDAMVRTGLTDRDDANHPVVRDYQGDVTPIGSDLMSVKGSRAPGATDIARRLEVMDAMGVKKQLMFPTAVALHSIMFLNNETLFRDAFPNRRETLCKWIRRYNEWGMGIAKLSDRIRPVLPLMGDTPEELVQYAQKLIDSGIRAVWILAGTPPGGRSPAHPDLDPLWSLLAKNNCVATLHLGSEGKFLETREWRNAPAFDGYRVFTESPADPWSLSVMHWPCQNFLTAMVTGGVFERHPSLRLGVIEVGAWWLGPLMELLDLGHKQFCHLVRDWPGGKVLSKLPSDYIRSNVRVSTFFFEDVDTYLDRYDCKDVLCFATDYPHVEGGKTPFLDMYSKVKRFGPEIVEKLFVKNAEFILPD